MTVNTTYLSWFSYMRQIAATNKLIRHSDGPTGSGKDGRKFFHSTLENFIIQTANNLPPAGSGPFMWFIRPARAINVTDKAQQLDTYELMFFILEGVSVNDPDSEVAAQNRCDVAVNQILSKFKHDSQANDPIWSRSMDMLDKIRIIPYELNGTKRWIGNQVSIKSPQVFNYCFNDNDWL